MTNQESKAQTDIDLENDYPSSQKLHDAYFALDRYGSPCLQIYDGDVTKKDIKVTAIKVVAIYVVVTLLYILFLNSKFDYQDGILIRLISFLSHAAVFALIFFRIYKNVIAKHNDEIRLTHCNNILRVSKYYAGFEVFSKSLPINDSLSLKDGVLSVDYKGFASTSPQRISGSVDFLTCINQNLTYHTIQNFIEDVKNISKKNSAQLARQTSLPLYKIASRFEYFKNYCDICSASTLHPDSLEIDLRYTKKTFLTATNLGIVFMAWPFTLCIVAILVLIFCNTKDYDYGVFLTASLFVSAIFYLIATFLSKKDQKTYKFNIGKELVTVSSQDDKIYSIPLERFLPAEFEAPEIALPTLLSGIGVDQAKLQEIYAARGQDMRLPTEVKGGDKNLRLFDADGDLMRSKAYAIEDETLVPWFALIIDTINDPIWTKELPPEPTVEEPEALPQPSVPAHANYAPYASPANAGRPHGAKKKSYNLRNYSNIQLSVSDTEDIIPVLNNPPVFDDENHIAPPIEHIALLGKYHNLTPIGSGAQASMFRALDSNNQPVGIKVFDFRRFSGWKDEELFEREVSILKRLKFKGIPKYIELLNHNPLLYLVESYIPAPSMAKRIKQGERLTFEQALTVLVNIAEILNYLETRTPPVIHRDIKPENLLVDDQYNVWLVDFGVVAADVQKTNAMTFAGTAGYMAPEQITGKVTPATDIYAAGISMLVYMTGKSPDNMISDSLTIDVDKELPINVPGWFRQLLSDMTQPLPESRIQNAAQIIAIIDDCYGCQ